MCAMGGNWNSEVFAVTCCLKEEGRTLLKVVMVEGIGQKMEGSSVCSKTVVYFMISFRQLCVVTVSLPLCALLICFVTAYIFQPDDIHETHCRVSTRARWTKKHTAKRNWLEFTLQYKKRVLEEHMSSEAFFPRYGLMNILLLWYADISALQFTNHSMQLLNLPHSFKIPYPFTATCRNIHMTDVW
jgi:hypothetical protein